MAAKRRLVRDAPGSLKFKIVAVSPFSSDHLPNDTQPPPSKQQLDGGGLSSGSSTDSDEYRSTTESRRQLLVKLRVSPERLQQKRILKENTKTSSLRSRSTTKKENEEKKRLLVKLKVSPEQKERLQQRIKQKKTSFRSTTTDKEKEERKRRLLGLDYYCHYSGYHHHQQIEMTSRCVRETVHRNTWRDTISYDHGQIVH